jgi:hypothetical protein
MGFGDAQGKRKSAGGVEVVESGEQGSPGKGDAFDVGFFFEGGDAGGGFFIQPDAEGAGVFFCKWKKMKTKLKFS